MSKAENDYADYEDISDALIWHRQEGRIDMARYDELRKALTRFYDAYEGYKRIRKIIDWEPV